MRRNYTVKRVQTEQDRDNRQRGGKKKHMQES